MIRLAIVALLGGCVAGPAWAQSVPPSLREGQPYTKARVAILAAGWQAAVFNKAILEHLDRVLQAWYLDHGYLEIDDCAPTGSGLCTAVYHDAAGHNLYVFSTSGGREEGAYKGAGPTVRSFCLGKRTVNCD